MEGWPKWARALRVPGALYGLAAGVRNAAYDRGWLEIVHAGVPVVGVGNLTVGGTGKTPVVDWLARSLAERGRRPGIVARGYGGSARGVVVVGDGSGAPPRCGPERCGDEPFLHAERRPDCPVVVGVDRAAAARAAARAGADVVVVDDGFQHRRLHRDVDVVLIDARQPPRRERIFPAGRLREPAAGLARAHAVLLTRAHLADPSTLAATLADVATVAPDALHLTCRHRLASVHRIGERHRARPVETLAGRSAVAFAGVADPYGFRRDLRIAGVEVRGFVPFPDHHRYRDRDLETVHGLRRRLGAELVLTTGKDAVKLLQLSAAALVDVVEGELEVDAADELLERIVTAVVRATRSAA